MRKDTIGGNIRSVGATTGGMWGLGVALDDPDPLQGLAGCVDVFARFWGSSRRLTRRLHALAAMDADFEEVIRLRQERRRQHLEMLLPRIAARYGRPAPKPSTKRSPSSSP